jgi:hypothetical protein
MVDTVDSFLNNAVGLYVQAVDYCRISTSQIPTLVDAGIRQIKSESGDVRQMSPDSGDTNARFQPDWPGHLAGILDGFGRLAGILAEAAGSPAIWPDPVPDPARTPDHRPSGSNPRRIRPEGWDTGLDLARTARPPASGRIWPFWPETGQDGRLLVN